MVDVDVERERVPVDDVDSVLHVVNVILPVGDMVLVLVTEGEGDIVCESDPLIDTLTVGVPMELRDSVTLTLPDLVPVFDADEQVLAVVVIDVRDETLGLGVGDMVMDGGEVLEAVASEDRDFDIFADIDTVEDAEIDLEADVEPEAVVFVVTDGEFDSDTAGDLDRDGVAVLVVDTFGLIDTELDHDGKDDRVRGVVALAVVEGVREIDGEDVPVWETVIDPLLVGVGGVEALPVMEFVDV